MTRSLFAVFGGTQILAEERDYMILKTIGDGAGMSTLINPEAMGDAIVVEHLVEFDGVKPQAILVTHVNRDSAILA